MDGILGLDRDVGDLGVLYRAFWVRISLTCFGGSEPLVTDERLSLEDAIWPLTREACRMGWRWGVLALGPLRTESTYHQM
jgi:hypothetical protein